MTHSPRAGCRRSSSSPMDAGVAAAASVCRLPLALLLVTVMLTITPPVATGLDVGAFTSPVFRRLARADGQRLMHVTIALRPTDSRALESRLWRVADPRSAEYGRHLTTDEVNALSRPADGAVEAVRRWLEASEAEVFFSPTTNMLQVPLHVRRAEELLVTDVHEFVHERDPQRRILRASRPITVPSHLHDVVSFVNVNTHPLALTPLVAESANVEAAANGVGLGMLSEIRRSYGIPNDLVVTNPNNAQALPSFYRESWNPKDLESFYKEFLPGDPVPRIIERGTRQNNPSRASIEASLDVQYITGVARNASTYVWTMNGSNPYSVEDEPFVEFAQAILDMQQPPYVVSISYSDDEEHIFKVSPDYARYFDTLLIKMGLRGISVLIASGDDGVAGLRPEFAKVRPEDACKKSGPQWPTSSPYITTVGATMHLSAQEKALNRAFFRTSEEVVCSGETGGMITTGGGFSNIYATPEYQKKAVSKYLKSKRIPLAKGYFNASGRAYPDIAALGANFPVYMMNRRTSVSGTSASTPVVAAMVTLWNDIRLNDGNGPLGFLNPLLYHLAESEPQAFNDVVVGNNGAAKGPSRICEDSFGATSGWDAVTGIGTPNFAVIADFVRKLGNDSTIFEMAVPGTTPSCSDPEKKPALTVQSSERNKLSQFSVVVIVVAVLALCFVLGFTFARVYRRWQEQRYTSLSGESTPDATSSPGASARNNGKRRGEDVSGDATEMSEISLHD